MRSVKFFSGLFILFYLKNQNIYFKINRAVEFALSRNPPSKTRADSRFYNPPVCQFRYDVANQLLEEILEFLHAGEEDSARKFIEKYDPLSVGHAENVDLTKLLDILRASLIPAIHSADLQ